MALRIEKNIPIWTPAHRVNTVAQVSERMDFGDSVFCKEERKKLALISALHQRHHKAVSRQVLEAGKVVGWRVWKMPK